MTKITIYNVHRAVTQSRQTTVMVFVFCMSSHGENISVMFREISRMVCKLRGEHDFMTDIDRRMDGHSNISGLGVTLMLNSHRGLASIQERFRGYSNVF